MKLFSTRLEMQAIYNICEGKSRYSSLILGSLEEEHFFSEYAKEAIARIKNITRNSSEIPSLNELSVDPVISEDTRKALSKIDGKLCTSGTKTRRLIKKMYEYYQLRELYFLSESINDSLVKSNVNVEDVLKNATSRFGKIQAKNNTEQPIYNIGGNRTANKIVKKLLDNTKPEMLPTGFDAFDRKNGGLFYGSLVILGGTTGGGKSSLSIQMLKNFVENSEDVAYVPLEMTEGETLSRLLANVSGISLEKILQKKLTKNEKKKLIKEYKTFQNRLKKQGNVFTIMSPENDMTAEDIFMMLKPYKHRVIVIDYISLLKGVGGDNSWQKLGEVARYGKIYAKQNNMIVILLAQVNKEGELRYSQAVAEHANNAWFFVASKESQEAGLLNIVQKKARNQSMFDFSLRFRGEIMRITDVDENDTKTEESELDEV